MRLGRPFWTFWSAAVLVNLGDGIRLAAFPLLAAWLSGDPLAVGAVAAAGTLPWLLTGPVAGVLADRHGARVLLPSADGGRVLVLLALVALLLADRATVPAVALAAFLLGVAETVRDVATETAVPRLVPTALLERANGRLVAGTLVGNEFVGPLVGGLLFAAGAALPFLVNGAATAVAVLLVLSVPAAVLSVTAAPAGPGANPPRGAGAGLRWLARDRLLRVLAGAVAVVALADSAWFAVFVLYAEARLGLGAVGFGGLLALGAGGGLAGALLADRLVGGRRHRGVVAAGALLATATPCLLAAAPGLWSAGAVVVTTSAGFGLLNVAAAGLRQRVVPRGLLGRVTATWRTAVYGAAALGALGGGWLASGAGLEAPFLLAAALGVAATAAWWLASTPGPRPA
ncbi:MFS transporter [Geodermatophilus marinus]|uniref:MFS transporter n=1 Tax=Geodermatophilus sp. LHW52908 TaxID=2303986 RepID=UPI000E3D7616|nr:MFS transporter [Geodermatophilus sp. LHW52908]RFU19881.1 MFS transporter [Geodermatophilus sp. LHW52908]